MKNFKNEFGVTGTLALRKAFRDELLALGWIQQEDYRIESKSYIYCSNSDDQALKSNHFWYPDSVSNKNKLYQLPRQWDEALKAASEVVEEIPEYVECIKQFDMPSHVQFYKGKIYKVDTESGYVVNEENKKSLSCNWDNTSAGQITQFKPSTKEAYDVQNKPVFKEGDYIVRTWPSGKITLAQVKSGMFYSLETYDSEGGVQKGGVYGYLDGYRGIPYRLATPEEIAQATKPKFEVGKWYKSNPQGTHYIKYKATRPGGSGWNYIDGSEKIHVAYKEYVIGGDCYWANTTFEEYALKNGPIDLKEIEAIIESFKPQNYTTLTLGTSNIKITIYKDGIVIAEGKNSTINRVKCIIDSMELRREDIEGWSVSYQSIKIGCSTFTLDELKQIVTAHDKLNPSEW